METTATVARETLFSRWCTSKRQGEQLLTVRDVILIDAFFQAVICGGVKNNGVTAETLAYDKMRDMWTVKVSDCIN